MAITEKDSAANRPVGVSPNVVATLVVIVVLFALTALTYLTLAGRDIQQIVPVLTGFAIPTVTGLLALVKIDRQGSAVETIRRNTNGAFERMEQRMAALETPVHQALNTGEVPVQRGNTRIGETDPMTERFSVDPDYLRDYREGGTDNG